MFYRSGPALASEVGRKVSGEDELHRSLAEVLLEMDRLRFRSVGVYRQRHNGPDEEVS